MRRLRWWPWRSLLPESPTNHTPEKDQIAYLIQGLDPDQVARITIGKPGQEVILNRRGANFVVANLDNYPALTSEINKLITTCLDIQTAELYTDNPENHKDLGVTEDKAHYPGEIL